MGGIACNGSGVCRAITEFDSECICLSGFSGSACEMSIVSSTSNAISDLPKVSSASSAPPSSFSSQSQVSTSSVLSSSSSPSHGYSLSSHTQVPESSSLSSSSASIGTISLSVSHISSVFTSTKNPLPWIDYPGSIILIVVSASLSAASLVTLAYIIISKKRAKKMDKSQIPME